MELPMSSTTLHKHQALGRGRDLWFLSLSGVQSWSCLKLIWGSLFQLSPLSYCCSNAVLFQDKVYCEPQRKNPGKLFYVKDILLPLFFCLELNLSISDQTYWLSG